MYSILGLITGYIESVAHDSSISLNSQNRSWNSSSMIRYSTCKESFKKCSKQAYSSTKIHYPGLGLAPKPTATIRLRGNPPRRPPKAPLILIITAPRSRSLFPARTRNEILEQKLPRPCSSPMAEREQVMWAESPEYGRTETRRAV